MALRLSLQLGSWFEQEDSAEHQRLLQQPQVRDHIIFVKPKIIEIKKFPVFVGRKKKNNIILDNQLVSGEHAIILEKGFLSKKWYIQDLGSTHGTVIRRSRNTIRVGRKETEIHHGDIISFATSLVIVL